MIRIWPWQMPWFAKMMFCLPLILIDLNNVRAAVRITNSKGTLFVYLFSSYCIELGILDPL